MFSLTPSQENSSSVYQNGVQAGVGWVQCVSHSLSVKGVGSGNDVGAVPAHQEVHPVIEGPQVGLCRRHLCLLDDVEGLRRTQTQGGGVTGCLQTAVWIHAVHQAIWQYQTSHTHPPIKPKPGQTPGKETMAPYSKSLGDYSSWLLFQHMIGSMLHASNPGDHFDASSIACGSLTEI